MTRPRLITATLFSLYAVSVLAVTVIPYPRPRRPWDPPWTDMIHWIPFYVDKDSMLLNVIMFVPFGVLVPMLWRWAASMKRLAWLAFATSLSIELTQLVFGLTLNTRRTVDINDLIANTAGAAIGLWVLRFVIRARAEGRWPTGSRQ